MWKSYCELVTATEVFCRASDYKGGVKQERRAPHAVRPGFRITELQIGHSNSVALPQQRFRHLLCAGWINPHLLQDPKEKVELTPGQS
jgi:hypothetical protein